MRARMRTIFTLTRSDGVTFRGDCPAWAYDPSARTPLTVTTERTLWLGPAWPCTCRPGAHN